MARKKYNELKKRYKDGSCTQFATFELLDVEPDTNHHYIAFFKHGWNRDDAIELNIKDGILSGAESTVTDRTLDIVLEGAKSLAIGSTSLLKQSLLERTIVGCSSFVRSIVIDPTGDSAKRTIEDIFSGTNLLVKIKQPSSMEIKASTGGTYGGLVYRRRLPYVITICEKMNGNKCGRNRQEALYRIPDSRSVMVVPINSGRFVSTKHTLVFDRGQPSHVRVERDSELLALASLPLTIAKAILSVPAEIIQLKINHTSKESELTAAERNLIEAQQELLKVQSSSSE